MSASHGTLCVGEQKLKQGLHTNRDACNICEQSHFSVGEHLVAPRLWSLILKGKDSVICQSSHDWMRELFFLCRRFKACLIMIIFFFFFFASCLLGSRVFLKMLFYLHWIRTEVYCFSLNMILWIKQKFDMTVWYLECKRSVIFFFLNGVTPCYRKTVFVLLRNMAYIIWNCLCGRVPFDNIVLSKLSSWLQVSKASSPTLFLLQPMCLKNT